MVPIFLTIIVNQFVVLQFEVDIPFIDPFSDGLIGLCITSMVLSLMVQNLLENILITVFIAFHNFQLHHRGLEP
jgi:hypothetical protein